MISKQAQEVIAMLRTFKQDSEGKEDSAADVIATRKMLDEKGLAAPIPQAITVVPVDDGTVKGEFLYYHEEIDKIDGHIILFIHGGGFMTGSVISRRPLCAGFVEQARMDAFSVSYGQWPEAVHPVALNDCLEAYHWLIKKGYKPENIHFFGESAGAMLTLTTILYLKDHGEPLPQSACVFSPVAGFGDPLKSHTERADRDPMIGHRSTIPYYGETEDLKDPYLSPRYGEYKRFPRLSIHVGSEEVLFDDAMLIETLCREAGVDVSMRIWEELFHVFVLFPCPETDIALKEIGKFFREE